MLTCTFYLYDKLLGKLVLDNDDKFRVEGSAEFGRLVDDLIEHYMDEEILTPELFMHKMPEVCSGIFWASLSEDEDSSGTYQPPKQAGNVESVGQESPASQPQSEIEGQPGSPEEPPVQ